MAAKIKIPEQAKHSRIITSRQAAKAAHERIGRGIFPASIEPRYSDQPRNQRNCRSNHPRTQSSPGPSRGSDQHRSYNRYRQQFSFSHQSDRALMPIAREHRREQQAKPAQRNGSMEAVQANRDLAPHHRNHQRHRRERKKQLVKKDLPAVKADVERLKDWKRSYAPEIAPLRRSQRHWFSLRRNVEGNCRSRRGCTGHRCSAFRKLGRNLRFGANWHQASHQEYCRFSCQRKITNRRHDHEWQLLRACDLTELEHATAGSGNKANA